MSPRRGWVVLWRRCDLQIYRAYGAPGSHVGFLSHYAIAGLRIRLTSAATGGNAEVFRAFAAVCRTLEGGAKIPGRGVATQDTGLASSRTRVSIPAFGVPSPRLGVAILKGSVATLDTGVATPKVEVPSAGRGIGSPRAGARHPGSSEEWNTPALTPALSPRREGAM